MRFKRWLSVLLLFVNSALVGMPVPFYPATELTCQYMLSGVSACAFKHRKDDIHYPKYARGIRTNYQNSNACLMRVTTTNPDLLAGKPLRNVSRSSDQSLYHIWWLEMDSDQLTDLDCINTSTETDSALDAPALITAENIYEQHPSGWEYPQGYCLMKNDDLEIAIGLTDKVFPHICQAFDSQLQGVYGNTLQKVFIDSGLSAVRRYRRSNTDVNDVPTTAARNSIPAGFTWSDLGTKILIFCVVASVFPTMVMTAHTKCCGRR